MSAAAWTHGQDRRWWVLLTMTGSLSMILIDQTVVSVALPTMERDLDLTTTGVQWVVNAYLLAIATTVAIGGRLGDLLGHVVVFRAGAVVFVLASAACGLAQSEAWIIVARACQGLGAAMMTPSSQTIVINTFPAGERGRAMGVYAGVSMIALALGPLIGGLLVEGVTWRAVFYVNVPIGVAMLTAAHYTLRREAPQGGTFDRVGAVLLVVGVGALVLGLMQSRSWGWDAPATIALLAVAALALPALVLWELRESEPLVQMRLFAKRNFSADALVLAIISFALVATSVYGAIWAQDVLGFTPIEAGLSLMPLTIPLLLIAPRVGALYDRIGPRYPVSIGTALVGLGLGWNAAVLSKIEYAWIVPGYVAMGVGLAFVMGQANTDALNAAPRQMRGQASGVVQTSRQIGSTLGIAIIGTVVAHVQQSQITDVIASRRLQGADVGQLERAVTDSGGATGGSDAATSAGIPATVIRALHEAVTSAISSGYWLAASLLVVTAVVAFALLRRQIPTDAERDSPVTAPPDPRRRPARPPR